MGDERFYDGRRVRTFNNVWIMLTTHCEDW